MRRSDSLAGLYAHFARMALRRWPGLLAVVATSLGEIAVAAARPWPIKVLVDNALGDQPLDGRLGALFAALPGDASKDALVTWCVAATALVFLLEWLLTLAAAAANVAFGQRLVYDLGVALFRHVQRLSLRFHSNHGIGALIRRVTTDAGCIATIVSDVAVGVVTAVLTLMTMVLIMWRLDPSLTLLALATVPFMLLALRRYARAMTERSYAQHEAEGRLYDVVEETVSAIPIVQAFGAEPAADRRLADTTREILRAAVAAMNVQFRFKLLVGFTIAAGTAGLFWLGGHQALAGEVTLGTMIVFVSYLSSLYEPLEGLMYSASTLQDAAGGARRVDEILRAEPEVAERRGARALGRLQGHVRLEGVRFGYEPGRDVLCGVDLEARPGEVLALVGPSGAGKSTLAGLIPRFYDPRAGRVTIDGQDVRDVQLTSLRRQVAVVLQDAFLFPVSVADNIAYGRPEASRDEIMAAAAGANAHRFIDALPDGYDTRLGERGATLSGGERQRLAIARALLKDAPILILDEPTSALDHDTEHELLDALRRLMQGRTTLLIAHRQTTIRRADRCVTLAHGRIADDAPAGAAR